MASAEIGAYESAMEELLAALADPQPEGLSGAWTRCEDAGHEFAKFVENSENLPPEVQEQLRDGLDRMLRLNAIARETVLNSQRELTLAITDKREKSAQVRAYSTRDSQAGGTCNLAG